MDSEVLREAAEHLHQAALKLLALSREPQRTTASVIPTAATPDARSDVDAWMQETAQRLLAASIALLTPASSLQPGDQMVADLFHAAHCSTCAETLGVFLAQCRTHALAAGGRTLTSVSEALRPFVVTSQRGGAPSPLSASSEDKYCCTWHAGRPHPAEVR